MNSFCKKIEANIVGYIKSIILFFYIGFCRLQHLFKTWAGKIQVPPECELVACDICESKSSRYLFSRIDKLRYSNIKKKYLFNIVKCRTCGLIYINPRLKESVLHEIYEYDLFETYKYDDRHKIKYNVLYDAYHDKLDERLEHFECYMSVIRKYIKSGKLLDIGTCFAYFLKTAEKYGFEVYGVEPSKQCTDFSKNILNLRNIYQGDFLTVPFEEEYYDAITMWHTIEHLHTPGANIKKICTLLRNKGHFFVSCPIFKESLIIRGVQPTEHLFYFTYKTLQKLVLKNFAGEFVAQDQDVFIFRKNSIIANFPKKDGEL